MYKGLYANSGGGGEGEDLRGEGLGARGYLLVARLRARGDG